MDVIPKFIVVDDDKFNNALCTMVIGKIFKDAEVLTFHESLKGFEHVIKNYTGYTKEQPVFLLLDINMPLMDGWQFLDKLNSVLRKNNESIKGRLIIYVLSSSVDKKDIDKALHYENVTDYIIKPITKDIIGRITSFETMVRTDN
jgi:CheY-like chemotaxis protein